MVVSLENRAKFFTGCFPVVSHPGRDNTAAGGGGGGERRKYLRKGWGGEGLQPFKFGTQIRIIRNSYKERRSDE